jgi:HAD superfamily hydrolase (TIGR01509 family)
MHDPRLAALLGLPPGNFDAFIFDCDGTLADTMPLHYEAWQECLREAGLTGIFPEDQFYSFGGVPTRVIIERLNAQHNASLDVETVFHAKEQAFLRRSSRVQPVVPVAEFAKLCKGRLRIGVASGGPRDVVEATLKQIGLEGVFDTVVTQCDVTRGKPAPDIYIEAARRLGVRPERCLVFEDAEPGRQSALAAGMQCVMVDARALASKV